MKGSTRDTVLLWMTAGLIGAVLVGYAWTFARADRAAERLDFGLNPITAQGAPAFLKDRVDEGSFVGRWVSGEWTAAARNVLRDEFPGFDRILTGYASALTWANGVFYRTLLPDAPLYPVGVDSARAFYNPDQDALVRITPGAEGAASEVDEFIAAARRLARANPDVTFVYYGVTPWRMTPAAQALGYEDPANAAWDRFSSQLQGVVTAGRLQVDTWSEMFFRTDHHWTPRGAYQGYRDIVGLLSQADPSLSIEPLPFSERVLETVRFRGATARKAAILWLDEPFRINTTHDPEVHAFLDGEPADELIEPDGYFPDPPNDTFASHYSLYNGSDYPLIEYRSGRSTGKNLLIFADSYSNSMEDLLAAGFDTTWVVDLRYYDPGKPFDIDGFIADKDITHVLFLSRPLTVMQMPVSIETGEPVQ